MIIDSQGIAKVKTPTRETDYAKRFTDFTVDNVDLYPDYIGSQDGGMYPERDVNFTNWVL